MSGWNAVEDCMSNRARGEKRLYFVQEPDQWRRYLYPQRHL